ncbi:hypothetical protein GS502_21865 [Rhodococcus hoagii]|nr:hypothetical protein [Prescottella equi]MBM4471894.1 hypothetical protein [Prescottella equi]MBM4471896.1 hypothetical protein [Prescottella equi]
MSQDLVRARRGVSNGPDSHLQQAETALAAAVHENNELRAEIARLGKWHERVAIALGMAEEVPGIGVHMASLEDIVARAESLSSVDLEHMECAQWCDECERFEAWQSCTHCNGSGCGPGTALGAHEECEWCAGDGREHDLDRDRRVSVVLPEVQRPEYYAAAVPIEGPGLNGAQVVRDLDSDRISFLGVPCPVQAEVVPMFAAALLAVHQDAVATGGDR